MTEPRFDLVTWGETMVRFSPPAGLSLEGAPAMEVWVGGTESNVAIALARLGRRVSWASRLPDNSLGRRVAREVASHGVDTSAVLWAEGERMGLNFIETATEPRPNLVLYDRADSAIARLDPAALDYGHLASGRVLHLTGITPALGAGCREAWLASARAAREAGREVALDINHRARLWSPAQARAALESVFPHVTLLLGAARDVSTIFEFGDDPEVAAVRLAGEYGLPLVVLTLGEQGALAHDGKSVVRHPAFPSEPADRIGAGDAFAAGFHHGRWTGDLAHALRCGNALAALQQTYRGDHTWSRLPDLLELVESHEVAARRVKR